MRVVEPDVQEKRVSPSSVQKLPNEVFNQGNVPPDLVKGIVFFRVRERERVDAFGSNVFLPYDPRPEAARLVEYKRKALDLVKGLEVVVGVVEPVHPVLVLWDACEDGRTGRGTAAH